MKNYITNVKELFSVVFDNEIKESEFLSHFVFDREYKNELNQYVIIFKNKQDDDKQIIVITDDEEVYIEGVEAGNLDWDGYRNNTYNYITYKKYRTKKTDRDIKNTFNNTIKDIQNAIKEDEELYKTRLDNTCLRLFGKFHNEINEDEEIELEAEFTHQSLMQEEWYRELFED